MTGLYEGVGELFEEDSSDFGMKDRIDVRLAQRRDWSGYSDELGKQIALPFPEVEAAAF